jgi:hypothetical protein
VKKKPARKSKVLSEDLGNQQRTRGEDREELAGAGYPDASADVNEGSGVEKKPMCHLQIPWTLMLIILASTSTLLQRGFNCYTKTVSSSSLYTMYVV